MTPSEISSRTVEVPLGDRAYSVQIAAGRLAALGAIVADLSGAASVVIVSDTTVADLYGDAALESLRSANVTAELITFPAGEAHKTLATVSGLMDKLFALRPTVDRDTIVVALGGGVTGDVAGFVAASALRGLRFVQCPTTLLADVDSSVGGKTGVDHSAGKNLIGAFHQPQAVVIDVQTLTTLPADEVRNGLAECVKHAVIRDATLLDFIEHNADTLLACQPDTMTEFIARNVAIKAAVVAADERESGQRAHLNYGHTIGHAIETCVGYDNIAHGQGVALGMVAEGQIAAARGLWPETDHQRVIEALKRLGLPVTWPDLDPDAIATATQHDKKARAGIVRFVLPTALGTVDLFDDVTDTEITAAAEGISG